MRESSNPVSRRKWFAGATTLGAVAATASLLPGIQAVAVSADPAKAPPAKGGGYTLSEHVKRYYATTLV
jgi:hypothetical protein